MQISLARIAKSILRQRLPRPIAKLGADHPVLAFLKVACVLLTVILVTEAGGAAASLLASLLDQPVRMTPPTDSQFRRAHYDAMVKAILDRPLFSGDRRPPPPPPVAVKPPPVLKSRLSGILILAGWRQALFAGDGKKYTTLREGDEIDGFKVRNIQADRVILASDFGEQIVQLSSGLAKTVRNTKLVELGNFDPDRP